ncbi:glycosyltransferase family 2 protein [Candidatus Gottesmanbacteria bacterium]|nr:glycosyltransferase family 2 protein [Candidatus Gottesmanbacteria bacterium]
MKKNLKISIVIVNYNSFHLLENCLNSIAKSSLTKNDYEVIVVDNASYGKEAILIKKKYAWVKVFANSSNEGFSKANNRGIRRAKGSYILLLNPDTIVSKESLACALDTLQSHPDAGIVTCKVKLLSGEIDDASHRGFPTAWNAFCHFVGLGRCFPKSLLFNGYHLGYQNMDILHEVDSCCGAFMLVRKKAGDEVGWLDEDYFWYGEDIDLCYTLKEKGWKILYQPSCEIIHLKGASSGIKTHSRFLSKADVSIQKQATEARFDVMKIFYKKHYRTKYPEVVTYCIFAVISIKKYFALLQYR